MSARPLKGSPAQSERRTKDVQRLQRRNDAWELRCRGWSQMRIARELGVSQATVSRDLAWSAERSLSNLDALVEQTKREHVGQLERVIDEAMQGWESSKQTSRTVSKTVKRKGASEEETEEETITTKVQERAGDVRYLKTAMDAMTDIRRILGADAPLSLDIGFEDIDATIARELEKLAARQQEGAVEASEDNQ